uniref:Uncharacterized protein n=1 Tax=Oryza punctata TaxID=4537 RepID=A0A0E0K8I1_ORYPU
MFNETNGATVAAEVTHKLKTKENYFTIGSSHAIDSSTLLKTRFSNGGKVGVLCQHEWRLKSTVSISAEYDPKMVIVRPTWRISRFGWLAAEPNGS